MPDASPALFVSRDRARRFHLRISRLLEGRGLAWRGASVGMSVVRDDADERYAEILDDLETSARDVVEQKVRDRERGHLDVPFAVMAEGLAIRIALARRIEEERTRGRAPPAESAAEVRRLLEEGLRRIDTFCSCYDEKRPLGAARPTDVARVLETVEREAAWNSTMRPPAPGSRAFRRPPPPLPTDVHGLEDLLRAARAALPSAPSPWKVEPSAPGRPLVLSLGDAGAAVTPTPERLLRAARVLGFLHPVEASLHGPEDAPTGVVLRLMDAASVSVPLAVAAAGGTAPANLSPTVERAVRALLAAPGVPVSGPVPPARLVALTGVLRALDAEIVRAIPPLLVTREAREAARIPREDTRKRSPKRSFLAALEVRFSGLPLHRVADLAGEAAAGMVVPRSLDASSAAVLLALVGGAEWEATVRDLLDVAKVRKDLEGGAVVDGVSLTRLERAAIAVLGRLASA